MKLIDLLIENEIEWPNGAMGVVQDHDGDVKFFAGKKPSNRVDGKRGRVWIRKKIISDVHLNVTASDYQTAIIYKREWKNHKNESNRHNNS